MKIKKKQSNYDIHIVIDPNSFHGNLFDVYWNICSMGYKVGLCNKKKSSNYNNLDINIKKRDIIEDIEDRKLGNLSYSINGINCGLACPEIPKDDILYPTVVLYEQGLSVEIV